MSEQPDDVDVMALADRFFDAIDRHDEAALRELYTPDVAVWHNHDGLEQRLEVNLKVLGWLHRTVADKRYEDVRRMPTPTGFVEQHVLRGTAPDGEPLEVPACLVVTVRDGRISRVEEYVDSAHIAALL
jgi:ketosteroid isomerase-like protein